MFMSERHKYEAITYHSHAGFDVARINKVRSDVEEPGHADEKRATATRRHKWVRDERLLLECYYATNPSGKDYMKRMWDCWNVRYPTSRLTAKQLVAQKKQLLEMDEVQHKCYGNR